MALPSPYPRERHIAQLAVLRASLLMEQVRYTVGEICKAQALVIKAHQDAFPGGFFLGEESAAALRRNDIFGDRVYELATSTTAT
ncbi:hypothetical protein QQZ08_004616 [Neonectria magnoliae]|uniref:Uncharacterized protein n=1 Tax=Neonectria magnoliae TaxID=2732573 RepID=A0ABR1I5S0_9HYPO